jgi:hypothetical protein
VSTLEPVQARSARAERAAAIARIGTRRVED